MGDEGCVIAHRNNVLRGSAITQSVLAQASDEVLFLCTAGKRSLSSR